MKSLRLFLSVFAFALAVAASAQSNTFFGQIQITGGNTTAWPFIGLNTTYDGNGSGGFRTTFAGYCAAIEAMQDNGRISFLTSGGLLGASAAHSLTERMVITASGTVGIGTSSPSASAKLEVAGYSHLLGASGKIYGNSDPASYYIGHYPVSGSDGLDIHWYGGVRIGVSAGTAIEVSTSGLVGIGKFPTQALDVNGLGQFSAGTQIGNGATVGLFNDGTNLALRAPASPGDIYFQTSAGAVTNMIIKNGGSVGIGTLNPGSYKLAVNGTIRAKEVIVDTGWSDYVFKPDYKLASLSEVEGAIKKEGHLPGIPSAADVAEHGISVGDMQSKLLAKVEELTLHLIELKKENDQLKSRVAKLEVPSQP